MRPDHTPPWGPSLLRWYRKHRRDLPWRRTRDPYAVWVSEAMLQQTQVKTATPYWERWMLRYPSVEALAAADEQEALALWAGLGYYRRCRNLLNGARTIVERGMPQTAAEWRDVPGVGPYTAGAISSICFDEPAPVVDGNVQRVYSRLTASPPHPKAVWAWAERHLDRTHPGDWNQALMELGATICKPARPECERCPIAVWCVARQTDRVALFPPPDVKPKPVRLQQDVWVPFYGGRLGVRQIGRGEWWVGMWEVPRERGEGGGENAPLRDLVGPGWLESLGTLRHTVTHHRITLAASLVRCEECRAELHWKAPEELETLPMPAPQRKILRLVRERLEG